jgi:hypothetical protein
MQNQRPKAEEMKDWSEMPDEVLQDIFQYLPAGNIICDLPAVCTRFFNLLKSGIKMQDLVIKHDSPTYIRSLVATVSICRRLKLDSFFFQPPSSITNDLLLALVNNFGGNLLAFSSTPKFGLDGMPAQLDHLVNVVVTIVNRSNKLREIELEYLANETHLALFNKPVYPTAPF